MITRSEKNGKLSPARKAKLDEIGFEWNTLDSQWEERCNELLAYKAEYGDMLVPQKWPSGLGSWVSQQKLYASNGNLSGERRKKLDDIGFPWENRKPKADWDDRFNELLAYKAEHGNFDVPRSWPTGLGNWVGNQRTAKRNNKILPERDKRLEEIGFVWNISDKRSA